MRFIFYLDHPLIRQLQAVLQWKMPGAQRQCIQIVLLRASGMMQLVLLRAAARRARRGPTGIVCQCVLHRSDDARARPPLEIFFEDIGPEMPSGNSSCYAFRQLILLLMDSGNKICGTTFAKNFRELRAQIHERRLLPSLSKPHLRSNILPIVKSVTSFPAWSHVVDCGEHRSGYGTDRFLGAVPAALTVELRLVVAVLLASGRTAPSSS